MYRLIGAASGWGAQIRACEQGPEILKASGLLEKLLQQNLPVSSWKILYPEKRAKEEEIPLSQALSYVHSFNLSLAQLVQHTLEAREFPIILGGDHSIAVGTWNGVYQHAKKTSHLPMGLIWIDAHMDSHVPQTTPSGAWHGMPLAGLLGYGDPKMAALMPIKTCDDMTLSGLLGYGDPSMAALLENIPVLFPEHVCLIGSRSFEEGEVALLKRLNVRIFYMDEVNKKGMPTVMREALAHVQKGTHCFGVSLDLDVMPPEEAPGVGSPEPGGIFFKELIEGLKLLRKEDKLAAFELVEYNPERNQHKRTAQLCFEILTTIMKKEE